MKKIFTTLLGVAALFAAMPVSAEVVTVSSKTDFENFFFKERTNEQSDTIYVKYDGILSLSNGKDMPNAGKIHIIGIDNEETGVKSGLAWQWNLPINAESDKLSIFFENLAIECNGGRTASSKYLFQTKDTAYHYIDTLSLVDCDITNYNRALFRVQPAEKADGTKDAGDVNYFGVERCKIYEGYLAANNPMSLFRMDMRVSEMVFRNNQFFDLGYVHSLVQFGTMTEEVGRVDINFTCENNLFIGWNSQSSLMFFDQYVGQMSEFHINNNLFIVPDWKDDYNNADIPADSLATHPDTLSNRPKHYIASIQYGQVECKNNVLVGYKTPKVSLDTEGEGAWLTADTAYFTPEELGYDKSIFIDFANRDFRYLSTQKMATAGSDGGPIGPEQLVLVYDNPCYLFVTSATEGVTLEPTNGVYDKGSEVTVTATGRAGAYFQYWTIGGEKVSEDNPYVFTIQDDTVNLVAVFEEKPVVNVNITLSAPDNVTMSIDPVQDDYFEGDSITVTFNAHYWADFDKWSDGVTEMNRGFRLTEDINLTVAFKKSDRIAVWDFDQITKGKQTMENGVGANHFLNGDSAYMGSFHTAYYVDGLGYKDSATIMTRNNKFDGDIRICAVRETPAARFAANPDYNYAIVNTTDYKGIKVTSFVGADAKAHKTQLLQYSLDGQAWETVASTVLDTIGEWYALDGSLPAAADKQEAVYIRWIGDITSAVVAHPDNLPKIDEVAEFSCVAGIAVKGTKAIVKPANGYYVEDGEEVVGGQQITSVADIVMTYGGSTSTFNKAAANAEISAATNGIFEAFMSGKDNPKDDSNKSYSSSKQNVPTVGTFYVFQPAKDGKLTVAINQGASKALFVTEDGAAMAGFDGLTREAAYKDTINFNVKAQSTYYVFCTGSKLGFGGFIYNTSTGLNNAKETTMSVYAQSGNLFVNMPAEAPVTVYNLLGQTVKSIDATQGENVITGLNAGIYLVRVADQLIKIKL